MAQSLKEPKASAPAGSSGAPQLIRIDDDYCAWVEQQAALLREGRLDAIDLLNVAEELSDMGKSERHRLQSSLRVLLTHMLKWDQQPERRSKSWVFSIREQRRRIERLLRDSPSLRRHSGEVCADAYVDARGRASIETDLVEEDFPVDCPYTWDEIMTRPFATDDQA
jgi:hypothetical protein